MGILKSISLAFVLASEIAYGAPVLASSEVSLLGGGNTVAPALESPSRLVNDADYESYVVTRAKSFKVTLEGRDPFGNVQDLTAKPSPQVQSSDSSIRDRENKVPLSEIINGIRVNMVYGGDKRIVVGSTPYKVGDQLRVRSKGKFFDLVLTEVTTEKLSFRSVETGQVATRNSTQRPKGMVPGGAKTTPQGLSSSNQSPPIIDVGVDESAP